MKHRGLVPFEGIWPLSHQIDFEVECDRIVNSTVFEPGISMDDDNYDISFKTDEVTEFTRIVGMSTEGSKGEDFVKAINEIDPELFDYIDKFRENDKYGDPTLKDFGKLGKISANTLRYIMSLAFIRKHFSTKLDNMTFVEIGGGYGGLCKVISCVVDFKSYTLIDLPAVVRLQRKYLEALGFDKGEATIYFYDTNNINVDKEYDMCISEYCISEFDIPGQEFYIDNVIGKSKNVYLLINFYYEGESPYNPPESTRPFMDKLKKYFDTVELIEQPEFPIIGGADDGKYIICKDNKNL